MLWGRPKKKKKKDCIFRVSRMQVKSRSTEQALAAVCTVVALGTRPDCVLLPEALGPVALVFTLFFCCCSLAVPTACGSTRAGS